MAELEQVKDTIPRVLGLSLDEAIAFAAIAHRGQVDLGGEPYILHVLRVCLALAPDRRLMTIGVLHDVTEDCGDGGSTDLPLFGLDIIVSLRAITRLPREDYQDYIHRLSYDLDAVKVKLADLRDNLDSRRLALAASEGHDISILVRRYIKALRMLEEIR